MASYKAPLNEMRFVLFDVLKADAAFAELGFDEANRDLIDAVLEEAARFNETVLAPINRSGDEIGCNFDKETGDVTPPPGFTESYKHWVDGGWPALSAPVEFGGQGLPHTLGAPIKEMVNAANIAWGNFPMLSHGAFEAVLHHGAQWQKDVYLPKLASGEWTGTMCLTEPHAGTDLGLLRTRAVPNDDGSYAISGTKIFITAGEHNMVDNIVHLVLAKLPDAPEGSRGISLFVVPKFKVSQDGVMGERNTLRCGAIEHKMGIHGSATCVMNFDDAQGWLVGEPHKGLMAMFTMMNSARLGVGLQGHGISTRAYENALRYARERLQSRAPTGAKNPDKAADPILVHPDVRRMLLTQKALIEGGRALVTHALLQLDIAQHGKTDEARKQADDLVGFLTPIVKGCLTEWGVENTYHAVQCFGGHGYIAEHGIEQFARDARITTLYEGTTGIQALDLMGRKTMQMKAAGLRVFLTEVQAFCKDQAGNAALAEFLPTLAEKASEWEALTRSIAERAASNPEEIGAAAYDYMFYSGYVALAYWWARMLVAADASAHSQAFKDSKRETARFYYSRLLPRTQMHKAAIESGAEPLMALDDAGFDA